MPFVINFNALHCPIVAPEVNFYSRAFCEMGRLTAVLFKVCACHGEMLFVGLGMRLCSCIFSFYLPALVFFRPTACCCSRSHNLWSAFLVTAAERAVSGDAALNKLFRLSARTGFGSAGASLSYLI